MAKKLDLRNRVPASPAVSGTFEVPRSPQAAPAQPSGFSGQMPLPPGQIRQGAGGVGNVADLAQQPVYLKDPTPAELAAVRAINPDFQPGDPLPHDFAARLQEAQDAVAHDLTNLPLPTVAEPLVMPPEQSFQSLPLAKQRELQESMRAAKEWDLAQAKAAEAAVPNAPPGVNAAIAASMPLVDDRQSPLYAAASTPAAQAEEPEPVREPVAGSRLTLTNCPVCSADLKAVYPPPPTEEERQGFLAAVLGGRVYSKRWSIMDDMLTVTARQLTPAEPDLIWDQLHRDGANRPVDQFNIVDNLHNEFAELMMRYRVALQLTELTFKGGQTHKLPETLKEWAESFDVPLVQLDRTKPTLVKLIADYVYDEVFANESVLRIVTQQVTEFNRLTMRLEANMQTSGFWVATPAGR